jgi:signal transduction histidine kinase/CheY-like chemotaxis protein/putative methionine-R-sulfoxide reductase with GAF domain
MPDRFESFVHLLQQLREPLLIASKAGRILSANVAAAEALGTSVASLEGSELKSLVPERALTNEWLESGNGFPVHGHDGRRLSCDVRMLSVEHLLLRLSGGVDPEPRLRKLYERVEPLPSSGLEDRTLHSLLVEAMTSVGSFVGSLHALDEAAGMLEIRASVGFAADNVRRFGRLPLNLAVPLSEAVRRKAALYISTGDELSAQFPELVQRYPRVVHSALACVPISVGGRVIAAMGLTFPAPWSFSDSERRSLETFAEQCAPAVQAQLGTARDPHASSVITRLELLQAFTGSLASTLTPGEAAEVVVDQSVAATSSTTGGLWLVADDGAALSLARSVGPNAPPREKYQRLPLDAPMKLPVLVAVRTGQPQFLESIAVIERDFPELYRIAEGTGLHALTCVPLFAQGRCVGALTLGFDEDRSFPPEEQAFLKLLGWHSAQTIERTRLYAAEQKARQSSEVSRRRSEFMADASMLLGSSLDVRATLAAVAKAAVPRMADWSIVELEDSTVPPVFAHTDPSKVEQVKLLSQRLRGATGGERGIPAVIRSGKSELYRAADLERLRSDVTRDPALPALRVQIKGVSVMVVPIRAAERPIGAILLASTNEEHLYDEHDIALAEDLGRRVGLALENARLYQAARAADHQKDEFLAMLGHELRNPLAPIVSALGTLDARADPALAPERALISRHVKHLVRLVDDLLDVARVTQGKIALHRSRCEVVSVVSEAIEVAEPLIKERRQHLAVGRPAASLHVFGDRARLTQVLANLLTNAARYTDAGGALSVSAGQEAGQAVIRVKDSGAGIAAEALPHIFELFVQASRPLDRARGGLGIGLTVVKRIVELHGGTVSAHSDGPGQGSEFVVRLPLAPADLVDAEDAADFSGVERLPAELLGLRVLVVDDNFEAATAIGEALEAIGCTARVVFDGAAALKAVSEFRPELSLLDIGLPVMDGYALARQLRALGVSSRLVALTGYGQASDRAQSRAAGFDEHVVKPVDLEALKGLLARVQR